MVGQSKPKRHHFLPEFYLNGFARNALLWLYDRQKDEYRCQTPKNTAVIGHYYTFLNEQGEDDYSLENFLSQVEGKAKAVIGKLEARQSISADDRLYLAQFIAFLLSRTPKFERETEQIADSVHKLLAKEMIPTVEAAAQLLRQAGKEDKITPESMFKFVHEERFQVKGSRNNTIQIMLDKAEKVTKDLAFMNWLVVQADERSAFITTDSPLGYIVPEEFQRSGEPVLGLASQKVTKLIPLTQRLALYIGSFGAGFGYAPVCFSRQQVREFNVIVATECERYVIGRDEALVRCVVSRSKVDKSDPGTRIRVENVPHPTDPMRSFLVARRVTATAPDKPLKIVNDK
jgi:hypothetical protein